MDFYQTYNKIWFALICFMVTKQAFLCGIEKVQWSQKNNSSRIVFLSAAQQNTASSMEDRS